MPLTIRTRFAALAIAGVLVAGCNEPLSPPIITISPVDKTVNVGQTVQFTATVKEGSDDTVAERTPSWFSSNVNVAPIASPSGIATALAVGTVTISVSYGSTEGTFYTKTTMLTVVPAGTPIASVKSDGIVLALGSTTPTKRAAP